MQDFHFRLYLSGQSPLSLRALSNLQAICQAYLPGRHRIEVIDVLAEPQRALAEGVLVTPTLVRIVPATSTRIMGDLSAATTVVAAFGIAAPQ